MSTHLGVYRDGAFSEINDDNPLPVILSTLTGSPIMDDLADASRVLLVDSTGTVLLSRRTAADNLALPTAPDVLATLMAYDGTTLDLLRTAPITTAQTTDTVGRLGVAALLLDAQDRWRAPATASAIGDGSSGVNTGIVSPERWNGASYDRVRNNIEGTLLASAARTADTNSADQVNYNGQTLHIQINVTVITTSVIARIQGKDPVSGTYYDILAGTSISATGLVVLKVGPGILAAAGAAAQDMIPRTWRVNMDHLDATTMTYSVGYSLNAG